MCTSVVVGEKATADGSFMIARSADSSAMKAQHFIIHESCDNPVGSVYSCAAHHGLNNFTYPQPALYDGCKLENAAARRRGL